jgi:predicted regulator of Ras-like GTPase activity (Roadblock/LC7/MglB family)
MNLQGSGAVVVARTGVVVNDGTPQGLGSANVMSALAATSIVCGDGITKTIQEVSVVHADVNDSRNRVMARWKQYGI